MEIHTSVDGAFVSHGDSAIVGELRLLSTRKFV